MHNDSYGVQKMTLNFINEFDKSSLHPKNYLFSEYSSTRVLWGKYSGEGRERHCCCCFEASFFLLLPLSERKSEMGWKEEKCEEVEIPHFWPQKKLFSPLDPPPRFFFGGGEEEASEKYSLNYFFSLPPVLNFP